MTFNYRFSVIPAGAIIDERVTPRALQVLCLLGRHTNEDGWCSRSQVKMAREIKCSRSALYDAFALLVETGWIERRRNGRGGTPAEASDQPFAAYSYRVLLDRENLPARINDVDDEAEGGAAPAAGGAAPAAGGAAPGAAPLEGTPSEGISSEPEKERDARARDDDKKLAALKAAYPTTATDDQDAIVREWIALPESERDACLAGVEPFLADLKKHKRSHAPALWKYIGQRRWTLLPPPVASAAPAAAFLEKGSTAFRAFSVASAIAGREIKLVRAGPREGVWLARPEPAGAEALAAFADESGAVDRAAWKVLYVRDARLGHQNDNLLEVERDRARVAAWRERVKEWIGYVPDGAFDRLADGSYARVLRVPSEWPPAKHASNATGPPDASAA